jgi:hypothetical protein
MPVPQLRAPDATANREMRPRMCFTVDRLADFGEDTARLSFIQIFSAPTRATFSH